MSRAGQSRHDSESRTVDQPLRASTRTCALSPEGQGVAMCAGKPGREMIKLFARRTACAPQQPIASMYRKPLSDKVLVTMAFRKQAA